MNNLAVRLWEMNNLSVRFWNGDQEIVPSSIEMNNGKVVVPDGHCLMIGTGINDENGNQIFSDHIISLTDGSGTTYALVEFAVLSGQFVLVMADKKNHFDEGFIIEPFDWWYEFCNGEGISIVGNRWNSIEKLDGVV